MYTKSTKIALGIVFSIILLLTVQLVGMISPRPATTLHHHLPTEASAILKIDNANLFNRVFFDLLYRAKFDKNDINQLEFRKSKTNIPETGIAINREIIIFYEEWNNKNIIGFLFHLKNEEDFAAFIREQNGDFIKAFNASMGCVLFIPDLKEGEDPALFEYYARDLLQPNPDRTRARLVLADSSPKTLFHLYLDGNENALIQHLSVESFVDQHAILFKGKAIKNPTIALPVGPIHFLETSSDKEFLEIQAIRLPDTVNVYLQKILSRLNTSLPTISSQHLIIYGFEIENIDGRTAVIPRFDAVFRFQDSLELSVIQRDLNSSLVTMENQTLLIGDSKFYLKQLSPTEIYLGINPSPVIEQRLLTHYFYLGGNPRALFNLTGKGIIAQIAQLLPPVQHTKQFFSGVHEFEFKATPTNSQDSIQVQGIMALAPDKIASIEIIKYLLKF